MLLFCLQDARFLRYMQKHAQMRQFLVVVMGYAHKKKSESDDDSDGNGENL